MIEPCASRDQRGWLELRRALWPEATDAEHRTEMQAWVTHPGMAAFVAYDTVGEPVGFVEVALRRDYVNGTSSSPVGFIEGLYVVDRARRRGVGRALVGAAEGWAKSRGCTEMASDVLMGNDDSHAAHVALGYEETDRVIYFRKDL